jgi:hypothetical protein
MNARTILDAHVPTWFKASLVEAAAGRRTYADIGHHLAKHLDDFFDDGVALLRPGDLTDADFVHPTRALRRLFASERHPEAGLVDLIPRQRRRAVLAGMACEEGVSECACCCRAFNR